MMLCSNIQSLETMVSSENCISEWVGHQIKNKKRGVWKNTQQTVRERPDPEEASMPRQGTDTVLKEWKVAEDF